MTTSGHQNVICTFARQLVVALMVFLLINGTTFAQNGSAYFLPGNLVVSRSLYINTTSLTTGVTVLPPAGSGPRKVVLYVTGAVLGAVLGADITDTAHYAPQCECHTPARSVP